MATAPSYIFGGTTGETPESIRQKRQIADMLLGQTGGAKNWGEGFNSIAKGLVSRWTRDEADSDQAKGNEGVEQFRNMILGTGGAQSASGAGLALGTNGGFGAGGPNAYRDAIASIESAGSGDYGAIGPTNEKLGRALGRYQVMEANIAPWSREALGREASADEFLANPELQDAIFDHRFNGYVDQFGPEGAAQAWFAGPGGVGQMGRQDVLGTSVSGYTDKFNNALGVGAGQPTQVASLDPSMGMPQQTAQLPPIGPPGGPQMAGEPQQALMQPQQAPAPQMAQADDMGLSLEQLISASGNPFVMERFGPVINSMLQQKMQEQAQARDPMHALDLEYKQAQIAKMQAEAVNGGGENYFGTLIKGYDAEGKPQYFQPGNKGGLNPVDLPEGFSPEGRFEKIDLGTEWLIKDSTTGTSERIPKDNFGSAYDTAAGGASGKADVDASRTAPSDIASGEMALGLIDQIRNHPELPWATGTSVGFGGNSIAGTGRFDFQNLVDQAKNGAFLAAVQQMRGMGSLSNAEGQAATSAITRMNTATSTEAFKQALDDYEAVVRNGIDRARRNSQGGGATPMPGGGSAGSPGNGGSGGWEVVGVE